LRNAHELDVHYHTLNGPALPYSRARTRVQLQSLSVTVLIYIIFLPALRNDCVNLYNPEIVYKTTISCFLTLISFTGSLPIGKHEESQSLFLHQKQQISL
jgi:hypothetical protein